MVAKTILSYCAIMLFYAYYLKTVQPISIFSPKDAYLISRQLQKKRVKFFSCLNSRREKRHLGSNWTLPLGDLSDKGVKHIHVICY